MNPFRILWLSWIEARTAGAAHARLRRLSDQELNDIGLERSQIVGAALKAAERRSAAVEAGLRAADHARLSAALHGATG